MRKILTLFLLVLSSAYAKAQAGKSFSLSFDADLNIPLNTGEQNYTQTRDYYQDGIGGNIKAEMPLIPELHLTGSAGFVYYPSDIHYLYMTAYYPGYVAPAYRQPTPYAFIPIKTGLRYYFIKYAYIDAQAGEAIKTNGVSSSAFIYSGGLGFVIPFNHRNGLDFGVNYERGYKIADHPYPMSQIGIGAGYKFGW
ncbi:MAG TPA: hypothetical protein VG603_02100 [Chitinophagales bacterium]|nr:hypothetical protein [Chitinophagales bacterium]